MRAAKVLRGVTTLTSLTDSLVVSLLFCDRVANLAKSRGRILRILRCLDCLRTDDSMTLLTLLVFPLGLRLPPVVTDSKNFTVVRGLLF
jgi:hypothetical protein